MSWQDELMKCGAAAAGGAASGAKIDALTGGASLGAGTAVGGLYACASASNLDSLAWRGVKSMAKDAWDAVTGLFEDDAPKKAPPSLDFALARTASSLEHDNDGRYRYLRKLKDGGRVWKEGDLAKIWHEANRAALYGDAGRALTPEALFGGLARMFRFTRPTAASRGAAGALLDAAVAFGDFLKAQGPEGDINTWQPTERLRQLAAQAPSIGVVQLPGSSAPTSKAPVVLGVIGVLTLLLGGGLIIHHTTTTPEQP